MTQAGTRRNVGIADERYPHLLFVGDADTIPPRLPSGMDDLPSIMIVDGHPSAYRAGDLAVLDDLGRALVEWYDADVGGLREEANVLIVRSLGDNLLYERTTYERPEGPFANAVDLSRDVVTRAFHLSEDAMPTLRRERSAPAP